MIGKNIEVCEDCPFNTAFSVSLEELDKNCGEIELHKTSERHKAAIGDIKLGQSLLSGVVAHIGCDGPARADDSFHVCPHKVTVIDARNFFEGPTNSTLQLEGLGNESLKDVSDNSPAARTGQYL